jgi:hypothetical protein
VKPERKEGKYLEEDGEAGEGGGAGLADCSGNTAREELGDGTERLLQLVFVLVLVLVLVLLSGREAASAAVNGGGGGGGLSGGESPVGA